MTLQACLKCPKGLGQVICGGCQQWFCMKHLYEHREDLSQKMDDLGHQRDQLQQNLILESDDHPHLLLSRVDRWESKSIKRIQQIAHEVRCQLRKSLDEMKGSMQECLREITHEFQESRQMEAYTEIDLNRWTTRLREIREKLETPSMIEITCDDDDEPASRDIRVIQLRIIQQNRGKGADRNLPTFPSFSSSTHHGAVKMVDEGSDRGWRSRARRCIEPTPSSL